MLDKRYRLTHSREIGEAVHRGKVVHTPVARLHILENPDQASSRVAVVVGKKIAKSAVIRHRYQRWLREVFKSHLDDLPRADIVCVASPGILSRTSYAAVHELLSDGLKKL